MAVALTVKVNTVGKYSKGANIGKDFVSFYVNRQIQSLRITPAMAELAKTKSYMNVSKLEDKDIYPTGDKDSSSLYPEGHPKENEPIYTAKEKLTVAEYWQRKGVTEPITLFQFDGFLNEAEERELAKHVMATRTLAF